MGISKVFELECDNCLYKGYAYTKDEAKDLGWRWYNEDELMCNQCGQYLQDDKEDL